MDLGVTITDVIITVMLTAKFDVHHTENYFNITSAVIGLEVTITDVIITAMLTAKFNVHRTENYFNITSAVIGLEVTITDVMLTSKAGRNLPIKSYN